MALGLTQPLTETSTGCISWGGKGGRWVRLTTLQPSCAVVMKSGNLNFLEPSGPLQACNGTALLLTLFLLLLLLLLLPPLLHRSDFLRNLDILFNCSLLDPVPPSGLYVVSVALFSNTLLFSVRHACPYRLSLFFNPFNVHLHLQWVIIENTACICKTCAIERLPDWAPCSMEQCCWLGHWLACQLIVLKSVNNWVCGSAEQEVTHVPKLPEVQLSAILVKVLKCIKLIPIQPLTTLCAWFYSSSSSYRLGISSYFFVCLFVCVCFLFFYV